MSISGYVVNSRNFKKQEQDESNQSRAVVKEGLEPSESLGFTGVLNPLKVQGLLGY